MKRKIELPDNLVRLGANLDSDFNAMRDAAQAIRQKLQEHADGKLLKGDEIVGWLGEVYGKLILDGKLMPDEYDYDVETRDKRVSVKARKGTTGNWQTTSLIPRIDSDKCPTHLMFIQFTEDYLVKRVWEFPWRDLLDSGRFKEKKVRGEHRGYYIRIKPSIDQDYLIYSQ